MTRINKLKFHWPRNALGLKSAFAALILMLSLFFLPSCSSGIGGSTGGNPLDSSLPLQISADAQ